MKRALITGITGQDGAYLSELLLSKGYEVHGIIRRSSGFNTSRIDHIFDQLKLHYGDITDAESIAHIIKNEKPDEVYNLAAQSHVKVSFEIPEYTSNSVGLGSLRILEAIRRSKRDIKLYQASSCLPAGTSILVQKEIERTRNDKKQQFKTLGTKKIEDINIGDIVLTFNLETSKKEYCKVNNIANRFSDNNFLVKFSNNNFLILSDNHPVYVLNKGWVRTDELCVGDKVIQKRYNGLFGSIIRKGKTNKELYGELRADEISLKASESQKNNGYDHPWKGKILKDFDINMYNKMVDRDCTYKKGNKSWNEGLTKDTCEILKNTGIKISIKQRELWENQEYATKMTRAFRKSYKI